MPSVVMMPGAQSSKPGPTCRSTNVLSTVNPSTNAHQPNANWFITRYKSNKCQDELRFFFIISIVLLVYQNTGKVNTYHSPFSSKRATKQFTANKYIFIIIIVHFFFFLKKKKKSKKKKRKEKTKLNKKKSGLFVCVTRIEQTQSVNVYVKQVNRSAHCF
jgi:preprotein translocase subunit YajC